MNNEIKLEIYDFYEPHWWDNPWACVAVGIVALLVVGALLYFFIKRRKKIITHAQRALLELKALKAKGFTTKKEFKSLYFSLTTVIKTYLHNQFNLKVLDRTDDELIAFIEEKQFHAPTLESLKKIKDNALLVKFANYDIIRTQVDNDFVTAQNIIETLDLLVQAQPKKTK